MVDPKANPRKSHNAHTWNVHLKNVVHGSTAKYHCGRQTRKRFYKEGKKKDCKLLEGADAKHVKLSIENFHS